MTRFAYVLASFVFLGLVGAKYDSRTGFTSLIRFGESWQTKRLHALDALPIAVGARESGGYDGQFYAQIAVAPLLRDPDLVQAIDSPAYRARRILVPATAALIGFGNPWRTLQVYALLNVLCWIALAWLLRTWLSGTDWISFARWSACMFSMGVLESVRQSLVDLPALLLLALAIRAGTHAKAKQSATWLALGNLAKETTFLGALALNAADFFHRGNRLALLLKLFLVTAPLGLWWLYVDRQFPSGQTSSGLDNFTWPFLGLLSEAKTCLIALTHGNFDGRFSFGFIAITGFLIQAAQLWLRRDVESPWWRVGAAYALLLPFLGLWVWSGYWAACRALLPLTVAFNLLLPANRAFWPLWTAGNLTLLHAVWRFL